MHFLFHNFKHDFSFAELIDAIVAYIDENPRNHYEIVVGTDSRAAEKVCFVTAVGVWRVGHGGRYFWTKSPESACPVLRDRIYKEAMQSIMLMQELKSALRERLGEEFFWDNEITVHIDVGQNGPTREFIDGLVGMVHGFGFEAEIKPYSFGASVLADRHT